MYENTPWERLALYAPGIALALLILAAIALAFARRKRGSEHELGLLDFGSPGTLLLHTGLHLAAFAGALGMLGVMFTKHWRAAHDTYPTAFGHTAVRMAVLSVVIGTVLVILWRRFARHAISYATLSASVASAAAVSAFSHTIIAEGQVTAMVLPLGYVVAALAATLVAGIALLAGVRDMEVNDMISAAAFLAAAFFMSQKLPVVQFHADSSLYPVTGGFYIVALGRLSRLWSLPWWAMVLGGLATIAIGYLLAAWYGIAIAAVGLSISGALGRPRLPSEEFLPPHSTRA